MTRLRTLILCLPLVACTTGETVGSVSSPLAGLGCEPGRRVGVPSSGRGCPAPHGRSGWTVSYLFQQASTITEGGQPFCLYEYIGAPAAFSLAGLPAEPSTGAPGSDWTDADCLGVVALNADAVDLVTPAHVAASHTQMGQPTELPSVGGGLPSAVKVAILDSSTDSSPNDVEPTSGEFLHGRAISMVNREHTCPRGRGDECIPDFDSFLVLDEGGDPAEPGGHYGRITTLARRLEEAVLAAGGDSLVIPLSVGWHPRFNHRDGDPSLPEAQTVKAVAAALDYAACQGALVMAAAGNKTASSDDSGPLCPACWEERVPSCDDQRPLVWAVGGVAPSGDPLPISRVGGQPPLVAAGQGISADNRIESTAGPALGSWTGTSMAVAHAGAVATLAWGYRPNLVAKEIMQLVRSAGRSVAGSADFCYESYNSQPCPSVQRVTSCGMLQALFSETSPLCTGGGCPQELPCAEDPSAEVDLSPATISALLSFADPEALLPQSIAHPISSTQCSQPVYGDGVYDPSQDYCPWESSSSYAYAPSTVDPQPGSNPCGVCAFLEGSSAQEVYLSIDSKLVGELSEATLFVPSYGYISLVDALKIKTLYPGDTVSIPLGYLGPITNYSTGPILSFQWAENPTAPPVALSVELPIYKL